MNIQELTPTIVFNTDTINIDYYDRATDTDLAILTDLDGVVKDAYGYSKGVEGQVDLYFGDRMHLIMLITEKKIKGARLKDFVSFMDNMENMIYEKVQTLLEGLDPETDEDAIGYLEEIKLKASLGALDKLIKNHYGL